MKWHAVFLLTLVLSMPTVHAQVSRPDSLREDLGWFATGLGPAAGGGFSGSLTANFGRERVLQVGIHSTGELFGSEHSALSVGLGRSQVGRFYRIAAFAGPAVVTGEEIGVPDGYTTAGLVLSAQAIGTPVKELGLGFTLFTIASLEKITLGLTLGLVIEGTK